MRYRQSAYIRGMKEVAILTTIALLLAGCNKALPRYEAADPANMSQKQTIRSGQNLGSHQRGFASTGEISPSSSRLALGLHGWRTYSNKDFQFSFNYPPGWDVREARTSQTCVSQCRFFFSLLLIEASSSFLPAISNETKRSVNGNQISLSVAPLTNAEMKSITQEEWISSYAQVKDVAEYSWQDFGNQKAFYTKSGLEAGDGWLLTYSLFNRDYVYSIAYYSPSEEQAEAMKAQLSNIVATIQIQG